MEEELASAYELVLADLENRNSHTLGRLLKWEITQGDNSTALDPESEVMFRALLAAKNFIEAHTPANSNLTQN